jgi:hypothetical protein
VRILVVIPRFVSSWECGCNVYERKLLCFGGVLLIGGYKQLTCFCCMSQCVLLPTKGERATAKTKGPHYATLMHLHSWFMPPGARKYTLMSRYITLHEQDCISGTKDFITERISLVC